MTVFDIKTPTHHAAFNIRIEKKQLLHQLHEIQALLQTGGKRIGMQQIIEALVTDKYSQLKREGKL